MVCMSVYVYLCVYSSVHQENSIRFVYLNTNSQDTSGASHVVPCLYDKYLYLSWAYVTSVSHFFGAPSVLGLIPGHYKKKHLWLFTH